MTILVTGATGNIGRHVVDQLVASRRAGKGANPKPGGGKPAG